MLAPMMPGMQASSRAEGGAVVLGLHCWKSRLMRTATRLDHVRDRALELAPRAPGYDTAIAAIGRDRHHGGGLLAGALAFRLFGALLPLALLLAVLLGYAATVERSVPEKAGEATGISTALLTSVAQSSKLTTGTRWVVAVSALIALLWTATSAARAIRAVHSIAWEGGVERGRRPVLAGVVLIGTIVAFSVLIGAAGGVRDRLGTPGLLISLAATAAFFVLWLGLAWLLPHSDASPAALIPGAVLVAVGVQVVHLGTALFVAGKVERAAETYGSLGVAFTLLVWLYVVSRVIVASAMLNAALWERPAAASRGLPETSTSR